MQRVAPREDIAGGARRAEAARRAVPVRDMQHARSVAHDRVQRWRSSGAGPKLPGNARLPFLLCALTPLAAPASGPAAGPGTGGTTAPSFSGGVTYGQLPVRPVASEFSVAPGTLEPGRPVTFAFRIDGGSPTVRVRIELRRAGAPAPAKRLRLGYRRTGRSTATCGPRPRATCPPASTRSRCRRSTTPARDCAAPRAHPEATGSRSGSRRPHRSHRGGLPGAGRVLVRRRGRALRRRPRGPRPPGPGHQRGRGHAARRPARRRRSRGSSSRPRAPAATS